MATSLFEKWAATRKAESLAVGTAITDKLLARVNEAVLDRFVQLASGAMARALIHKGLAPSAVNVVTKVEEAIKGQRDILFVDTAVRPTIVGYVQVLEDRLVRAVTTLGLPWWKLLWRRLRGCTHVALPWEVENPLFPEP